MNLTRTDRQVLAVIGGLVAVAVGLTLAGILLSR